MPGLSYGLPAGSSCNVGSKLIPIKGSVCHGCYALKGHYRYKNVLNSQTKRLESINDPNWVNAMVTAIDYELDPYTPYFRWHDAGDLQSMDHLLKIVEIARRMKAVNFWLPTREASLVNDYFKTYGALHPNNLVIRVSASMNDGNASKAFKHTSTVISDKTKVTCPSHMQGNKCGDCRNCWDNRVSNVSYRKH